MPYSALRHFVFVHVPKTAGESIMNVFRSSDSRLEYDDSGLWDLFQHRADSALLLSEVRRVYRINTLTSFPQQHLPATVLRALLGRQWDEAFTFGFVRNPWDLLVSTFHFLKNTFAANPTRAGIEPDQAELMRRSASFDDYVRLYPMIRNDMTSILCDERGEIMVDFVGRFEDLSNDFATVCKTIGISASLGHENRTEHRQYREYYTYETRAIVARHFARDIQQFGYEF